MAISKRNSLYSNDLHYSQECRKIHQALEAQAVEGDGLFFNLSGFGRIYADGIAFGANCLMEASRPWPAINVFQNAFWYPSGMHFLGAWIMGYAIENNLPHKWAFEIVSLAPENGGK